MTDGRKGLVKITDALLGEHALLYEMFEHLRVVSAASGATAGEIHAALTATERLLLSHSRIEEELLFPELELHVGQMGPLAVMRSEHRSIDDLLETARQETDAARLSDLIVQLIELAIAHFRKEEMVLFGMAQRFLGDVVLTELGHRWADSRDVALGGDGCLASG
jgi:iron-sulfur cluster repair protein YtfE (RIC family)